MNIQVGASIIQEGLTRERMPPEESPIAKLATWTNSSNGVGKSE